MSQKSCKNHHDSAGTGLFTRMKYINDWRYSVLNIRRSVLDQFIRRHPLTPMMSTALPQHPWSVRYVYLRFLFFFFRTLGRAQILVRGHWRAKLDDGVSVKQSTIPSRDKGRNIEVELYTPSGYDSTKPTPVVVNFHG